MRRNGPPILMYHSVGPVADDPNNVRVSPQRFAAQMAYLERRGLRGVCARELVAARAEGRARKLVGLTFDDGYEDFLKSAVPVLERHGFSATVFALSALPGAENSWDEGPKLKLLDKEGLREAVARGMEVGSHGRTHVRLSGLEAGALRTEVGESGAVLEEVIGGPVTGFCYPYGDLDARAVAEVRAAGYVYACGYKVRVSGDLYDLPRSNAGEGDGRARLALKLAGVGRYVDLLRGLR